MGACCSRSPDVTLHFADGTPAIELKNMDNGTFRSRTWFENGQLSSECYFINKCITKAHGPFTIWYSNGQKGYEATFVKDKKHGNTYSWYPNGQKAQEFAYVEGTKYGHYSEWKEDGKLFYTCFYVDGVAHNVKTDF
jgi:antitoxin component YwqK of YwqJK toxin-antitoxin module